MTYVSGYGNIIIMNEKLKLCVCGGRVKIIISEPEGMESEYDWYDIVCTVCDRVMKYGNDKQIAINKWNRRGIT